MPPVTRRIFLRNATSAALFALAPSQPVFSAPMKKRWRAAIIGDTGRGDFGHNLEMAFNGLEQVTVVGLADPNDTGRVRAAARAGAQHEYADYREMLDKESPDLVVVAPRWSDRHFEMAMAALEAGAHVLTEKPFTVTLAEADEILARAERLGRKVAVAHQMRLAPSVVHLRRAFEDGVIGELVHLRAWGKQDTRAGGEDLIVLGTHLFDMMRLFAGDATWCSAHVCSGGAEITRADARPVTEKIGWVAGDEIEAQFGYADGVTASFTSRGRLRDTLGPWALELLGAKGAVRILMDIDPIVLQRRRDRGTGGKFVDQWLSLENDPSVSSAERGFGAANTRVVLDWLTAIEQDREPSCSGKNATKALEFVMATYRSALDHARVRMPLVQREHPLV